MQNEDKRLPWFAHGTRFLDVPAWICDPEGRLVEVNEAGERLLGIEAEFDRGRPCREILADGGVDEEPVFGDHRRLLDLLESGKLATPIRMRRTVASGEVRWFEILPLVLRDHENGDLPWLLVLGKDAHGSYLMEEYMSRLAHRSGDPEEVEWRLTPREREILDRLARDEDSHSISRTIGVSYATVRNHIQRILRKMDAHSIQEAVARYILAEGSGLPSLRRA